MRPPFILIARDKLGLGHYFIEKVTFLYMCKKFTIVTTKFNQNGGKDSIIKSVLIEMIELGCLHLLMINKSRHSKEAVSTKR